MKRTLTLWALGLLALGGFLLVHWSRSVAVSIALAVLAGAIWGPWLLSPDRRHLKSGIGKIALVFGQAIRAPAIVEGADHKQFLYA